MPLFSSLRATGIGVATLLLTGCVRPVAGPVPPASVSLAGTASTSGSATPIFAEVADAAGLHYQWQVPGKPPYNILQTIGHGCAFLDYDNDGNLDILLVGTHPALFKGDGKGKFTDVTKQTGFDKLQGRFLGCAVGDYDNDGYADVYLTAYQGGALLHNNAGKTFADVSKTAGIAPQPWGTSAAWADIDNDGKLDLYVCNYVRFGPQTDPQLCPVNGVMSSCGPRFYKGQPGLLMRNKGGGTFEDVTRKWSAHDTQGKGLGAAFADFNDSGHQTLAIANDEMPGDLLVNNGNGFKNNGVISGMAHDSQGDVHGGMGTDWGDYDNNGKLDLFVATFRNETKCLYRNDDGFFTERSAVMGLAPANPYVTFGTKWLDYDNDGYLDLVLANGHVQDNIHAIDANTDYKQPSQLFHNEKGIKFTEASTQMDERARRTIVGRGLAVGDYDNDGKVDVLIVDDQGAPLLLHNESQTGAHYLSVRLQGSKSNRDGVGVLVTIEANGQKQVRRCGTDGSYMSASDKRVHFGLGTATTATVTVHWPDGTVDTLRDLSADEIVVVQEGQEFVSGNATAK